MPARFNEDFSGGLNTAADRSDLPRGQVTQSTGGFYRPGSRKLHKMLGRAAFGTAEASKEVYSAHLLKFDTSAGNDRLVAYANTTLYGSTDPSNSGTFSSLKGSLNSSANYMSFAHMNDRWYCANGYDAVFVVEDDGTTRNAGMKGPVESLTAVAAAAADDAVRPTAGSSTYTNESNVVSESNTDTYMGASLSTASSLTTTLSTFSGDIANGGSVIAEWDISGIFVNPVEPGDGFDDTGGGFSEGWNVTVKIEVSEDAGVNFSTIKNATYSRPIGRQITQVSITDGVAESTALQVKITFTYNSGTTQATLRVYDVRAATGSTTTNFSTTTGMYYAFTEYDQTRALESPVSDQVLVTLSTQNKVTLTLPTTEQNSTATHYRIYRTTDGGSTPQGLGLLGEIQVSETTYFDDFVRFDKDTQPFPLMPLLKLSTARSDDESGSPLYFPQNTSPPELIKIRSFKGSLVGLSRNNPRALYYSIPGRPESWPAIYVIDSFPFEEHDKLVDLIEVGDALVIAAEEIMMRTFKLPRVVQGTFDASDIVKIQGAPGCVGRKALTAIPLNGDPHAAWISLDGLFVTNGETFSSVSDDHIDWFSSYEGKTVSGTTISHDALCDMDKSGWVLKWDRHRRLLYFCFSSTDGGDNDLYYTIRIPTGRGSDQNVRWSGPHPGKINDLAIGQISNKQRVYSAHPSDGKCYTEWLGNTDASNAYDSSSNWPLIIRSRRIYGEDSEWSALSGNLRHDNFGTGKTATVDWLSGRDSPPEEQTLSQSVSVNGRRGTHFDIAKGGEWHEYSVAQVGTAEAGAALLELQIEARGLGARGTVKAK